MADDVKQQTVDALLSSKKDFTMKKNDGVPQKKIKLLDPVFAPAVSGAAKKRGG